MYSMQRRPPAPHSPRPLRLSPRARASASHLAMLLQRDRRVPPRKARRAEPRRRVADRRLRRFRAALRGASRAPQRPEQLGGTV